MDSERQCHCHLSVSLTVSLIELVKRATYSGRGGGGEERDGVWTVSVSVIDIVSVIFIESVIVCVIVSIIVSVIISGIVSVID